MAIKLTIVTKSDHLISGTWVDEYSERVLPFTYHKINNEIWNGEYDLVDSVVMYEYNVELDTGNGSNRFGDFIIIRRDEYHWDKLYVKLHHPKPPKFTNFSFRRTNLRLARAIRIVYKDEHWQLEHDLIRCSIGYADVVQRLKHTSQFQSLHDYLITYKNHRERELRRREISSSQI